MKQNTLVAGFAGLTIILLLGLTFTGVIGPEENDEPMNPGEVSTFESEEEFTNYIKSSSTQIVSQTDSTSSEAYEVEEDIDHATEELTRDDSSSEVIEGERIHSDGERLYYSTNYPEHIHVFNELPDLELEHNISGTGGELFTHNENLIISNGEKIESLDKENMEQNWERYLDSRLIEARQVNEEMIFLTRERVNEDNPCPRPIEGFETSCANIIYPGFQSDIEHTYTVLKINLENGDIENSQSFTADYNTEIQVNSDETVFTYHWEEKESVIITDFLEKHGYELLNQETVDRIEQIKNYELSERSINYEISEAIDNFLRENPEIEEELETRMDNYLEENKREFSETTVVSINNENFSRNGEVTVPGDISNIESFGQETVLISRIGGHMSGDRENDLHRIDEDFTELETYEGVSEGYVSSMDIKEDKLFISERDKITSFNLELFEIVSTFEAENFGNLEFVEGFVLNLEYSEEGTSISVLDNEFNEVNLAEIDKETRIYSASVFESSGSGFNALLTGSGYNAVLEFDSNSSEIALHRLDERFNNGLVVDNYTYLFNNKMISVHDSDFETVSNMDLAREREEVPIRPMPEPVN